LDFRIPRTPVEEIFHGLSEETFPAEAALELIGKKVLPEVLRAIEADSTSAIARENALSVWMQIYRESDEQPKGVSLLKQEENRVSDSAIKQKLRWAVQKALTYCNPPEKAACQEAAATGVPIRATCFDPDVQWTPRKERKQSSNKPIWRAALRLVPVKCPSD